MRRQARRLIVLFSVCFCIGGAGIGRAEAPPIVFPEDAGVVDVTQPPYHAAGDGVTDDTAAINAALRDHNLGTFEGNVTFIEDPETGERIRKNSAGGRPGEAWTVYLPEGTYRVSDTPIPRGCSSIATANNSRR
jgi:hypothetical protein